MDDNRWIDRERTVTTHISAPCHSQAQLSVSHGFFPHQSCELPKDTPKWVLSLLSHFTDEQIIFREHNRRIVSSNNCQHLLGAGRKLGSLEAASMPLMKLSVVPPSRSFL